MNSSMGLEFICCMAALAALLGPNTRTLPFFLPMVEYDRIKYYGKDTAADSEMKAVNRPIGMDTRPCY